MQLHDTIDISYYNCHIDSLFTGKLTHIKSYKLKGLQRYDELKKDEQYHAELGNVGLASESMIFKPSINQGFQYSLKAYEKYLYTLPKTSYYFHRGPLSYLGYTNGSKKEQLFRLAFSQTLGKHFTVTAHVNVINSPGLYENQKSDDKSVNVTAQYFTLNKRYGIIANFFHNKFVMEENGGITNDSIFENNLETNRRRMDVNLYSAKNLVKYSGTSFSQSYFLSKTRTSEDSTAPVVRNFHLGKLSHYFRFTRQTLAYSDEEPQSDYYARFHLVLDSNQTYDSLRVQNIQNEISWSNLRMLSDSVKQKFYIFLGIRHEYSEFGDSAIFHTYSQFHPFAELTLRPYKGQSWNFKGNMTTGNYNNGGYFLSGELIQSLDFKKRSFGKIIAEAYLTKQEPDYFYTYYLGNYNRWENDFNQENIFFLGVTYSLGNLKAGAKYYDYDNYVYLNTNIEPVQAQASISVLQLFLMKEIRIGKFSLDNILYYQKASADTALRLPTFIAKISPFFTIPVFKNAGVLQPGLDFFYNTAYYADAYLPAVRAFYIQNQKELGNYVYADIFMNLMVKRFRFFLKYQHFNALFSKKRYYTVPHYPMPDASLKFGIAWTFYD